MAKTILINHNHFEYQKQQISLLGIQQMFDRAYSDVYSAYEKPSWAKQNIWESWYSFFSDFDEARMVVASKNSFTFTIIAETKYFFFYITAWHKKVWLKIDSGMRYHLDEDGIIIPDEFYKMKGE